MRAGLSTSSIAIALAGFLAPAASAGDRERDIYRFFTLTPFPYCI
jgi:hypothetical protein